MSYGETSTLKTTLTTFYTGHPGVRGINFVTSKYLVRSILRARDPSKMGFGISCTECAEIT